MRLRAGMLMTAVLAIVASYAGIEVRATYGAQVSADEPQYLLTAISLAEDRDLDISDEIRERRYDPFHEVTLDRQTEPLAGGREVSPHDPLLPALLAIPVAEGGWRGAKTSLAVINGLLAALLVWISVRRFDSPVGRATLIVSVFAASAPLAVYGHQVYPELPAALAVAAAIGALTGELRRGALVVLALAIVALPWLSVKYAPVALAIALVALVRHWKASRRDAVYLSLGLVGAGLIFAVAHLEWYGGLTPYATGDHFAESGQLGVVGTGMDLFGRSRRLIGLWVDRRFGLIPWQPAYLAALPALGWLAAQGARGRALLLPLVAGWLNATFVALTMHGWWWPGRQVVVVLPAVVLATAWWASQRSLRMAGVVTAGVAGVLSYGWLVFEGGAGSLTWIVDFFETSAPVYRLTSQVMPDYLEMTPASWLLHGAWLTGALIAMWWGYSTSNSVRMPSWKWFSSPSTRLQKRT